MKRLVKTSLATALALATGQAFALGLGPIQVRSGLNQPLVAEIPVLADSPAEANELRVALASAEDFQRVGLSRGRVGVPIEFAIASNGRGQTVIKLTTKEIVREPFLDFLIEVNWSKGKLLREYTVLLDPPVTAPAIVTTSKPAARPVAPATVERAPAPAPAESRAPVAASAPAPAQAAAPRASTSAPRAATSGEYGPVQRGQALSTIARGLDVTTPLNLNQVMLALLKANPNAFYRDNVNALKTGAVLRIPSAEEVSATASLKEAAVAVQAQNQTWMESAKPTQVNELGAPTSTATSSKPSAPSKPEHLALVPPSGKGNDAASGSGGSGTAKDAQARADLARTKETLATREQESAELKSRVKQLEDINDKGQHLISLKDSEIAELQNKLKELQAKASAASAKAAETPSIPIPPPKLEVAATKPAVDTSMPAKPADTMPAKAAVESPIVAAKPADATPVKTEPATIASPTTTPAASVPPAPGVTITPLPDSAPAATTSAPSPAATAPAAATEPAKPLVKAATKPVPTAATPWWSEYLGDSPYPLYGIGALLLLLGAWAASKAFGKPKSVRPAYRDDEMEAESPDDIVPPASEQQLLDHLAEHPDDVDASMELLRHYYVQGDTTRFEALAEKLQHQVAVDSHQWAEVVAMGEDLSPHHHLFTAGGAALAAAVTDDSYQTVVDQPRPDLETQRFEFEDFNDAHAGAAAHHDHAAPAAADEPMRVQTTHVAEHADHTQHEHDLGDRTPADHDNATEFFAGEDTISTRLDLARAYLDMGDPEGARSMLDEVLTEGNAAQKEEARKLLAEIR
ncbi:MAG: FimV/HubP family polar landmark protein [Rudaea sp.]